MAKQPSRRLRIRDTWLLSIVAAPVKVEGLVDGLTDSCIGDDSVGREP